MLVWPPWTSCGRSPRYSSTISASRSSSASCSRLQEGRLLLGLSQACPVHFEPRERLAAQRLGVVQQPVDELSHAPLDVLGLVPLRVLAGARPVTTAVATDVVELLLAVALPARGGVDREAPPARAKSHPVRELPEPPGGAGRSGVARDGGAGRVHPFTRDTHVGHGHGDELFLGALPEPPRRAARLRELAGPFRGLAAVPPYAVALAESISELSAEVERVITPFSEEVELLETIPGVNRRTAEVLIAEIGADMSRFPSHAHLASWAGMCPGNDASAGKRRSGKTRKGSKWLLVALTEAAHAASRSKRTYLSAQYVRLRGRRGPKKAAVAVGYSILVICYHILQRKVPYEDLGEDHFQRRRCEQAHAKRLVRQLENLGHRVVLESLPQPA